MRAAPLGQCALTLTPDGGLDPPALQRESVLFAVALAHCPTRKQGSGGTRARSRVGAEVEWAPLASPAPQACPVTALPSGFTETRGWLCPRSHVEPRPWAPGWRWKVDLASLVGGAATGLLVWALVASLFHKVPLVILGARRTEHPPKTGGHPPAERPWG